MEQIPVTIRLSSEYLNIIDEYAKEQNISRSEIFRKWISQMTKEIEEQKFKVKITNASFKVRSSTKDEIIELEGTVEDGLSDV